MNQINPSIKSFLIFLLPSLILWSLVFYFQTYAFFIWSLIIQLGIYFVAGAFAGRFYYQPLRRKYPQGRPTDAMRAGSTAGIWLSSFILFFLLLLTILLPEKPAFLTNIFLSIINFVLFAIINFFTGMFLAAAGGRSFHK